VKVRLGIRPHLDELRQFRLAFRELNLSEPPAKQFVPQPHAIRIRALNDQLRQHLTGGTAVITPGVAALGPEAVERIVKTIAVFGDFCHANDPYEEHDWSFEADGTMIYFKIDYFDRDLSIHSPDPADPSVTHRIITIMLAEEY
jgi:hypothetical protein